MKNHINKVLTVLLVAGLAAACTTTKKRSEMSALGKVYHNTTAHYNGYFNANELIIASQARLEQQHQDNYTRLLPMYKYLAVEDVSGVAPDLDIAMEKVSVVVNLHPYSKWTDDSYLLFGKAQYLKRDYESAEETWRYFEGEFNPEEMERKEEKANKDKRVSKKKKKRKKKKKKKNKMSRKKKRALKRYNRAVRKARRSGGKAPEKPEILTDSYQKQQKAKEEKRKANEEKLAAEQQEQEGPPPEDGFLKHRLAYQEGMLFYAKTMVERDKIDAAQRILDDLLNSSRTFEDIKARAAAVQAYLYIQTEQYVNALPALKKSIELQDDKSIKARHAFIMAQLYDRVGNSQGAYAAYEQCLSYRPAYEMEFNCQLNMAQHAWASGQGSARSAREKLQRLLKEEKNAEYKDQIYFSLAMIAFKEGDQPEGVRNLQLALRKSQGNKAQQAEAYLTLADLYYQEEDYVAAKNYYDSTLMVMNKQDDRYQRAEQLAKNLTDIAKNLEIISLQDSLLRISEMSVEEQEALALRIKQKRDEERRKQLIAEANRAANAQQRFSSSGLQRRVNIGSSGQESSFFAYDERALRRGARDFQREWGARKLEDNWRRSSASSSTEMDELLAGGDNAEPDILTEEEIKKLLGDVPESEKEQAVANLKIQEAMAKLGSLYRERLDNNEQSIEILEELNRRYPGNSHELDAWYQLYLAYGEMGNAAKAKEYGDKILEKYPSTDYAKIIQNPNYADELMKEKQELSNYYQAVYQDFQEGNYQRAYEQSVAAKRKFGASNRLQPKFALLAAMCTGNLQGKEAYIKQLKGVVARYPDTEEQLRAREILRLLGQTSASLPAGAKEELKKFKFEENKLHYIIVAFDSKDIDLNQSKISVSDYNEKYHKLDRIRISNLFLGIKVEDRVPILVLRRFKDKAEAMAYYNGVQNNRKEFMKGQDIEFDVLPVTQNNYREILKERSVDNYRLFFKDYYLN